MGSDYSGYYNNGYSYDDAYPSSDPTDRSDAPYAPYAPQNGTDEYGQPTAGAAVAPSSAPDRVTNNVAESTPTVLVYLKDGTMFAASDYWQTGNQFHYVVSYGAEGVVDLGQVDMQRTTDENAKRGIRFTLRTRAAGTSPASSPGAATPDWQKAA